MTVIVAGKLIQDPASLSELARQVLACIDGGVQWLAWAIPHPQVSFTVADETALLDEVQQGLHGSPMTLLPKWGLMLGPVKLMTLGSANLRLLAQCESGDASSAMWAQAERFLLDQRLYTAQQLNEASAFLSALGVGAAPLFQAIGLNERVTLTELAIGIGDTRSDSVAVTPLRKEAAAFAVEQARTVAEFCDYYQFYLVYARKRDALSAAATVRAQLASEAMATLLPLAFGALDCPQLEDRLPAPMEVDSALRHWLARGGKVGFARLSQAVLQVAEHSAFTTETGAAAARLLEQYLGAAHAFLDRHRIEEGRLEQDGATLSFTVRGERQQARLHLSAARVLSLRSFGSLT